MVLVTLLFNLSLHAAPLEVVLPQGAILLSDVVQNVPANLSKVEIGQVPGGDEKIEFTSRALAEFLRVHLSSTEGAVLPDSVVVVGLGPQTSISRLSKQISEATKNECGGDCEVELLDLRVTWPAQINRNFTSVNVSELKNVRGSFTLPVQAVANGKPLNGWITGSAKVSKNVPVASRLIRMGERISAEDITVQKKEITNLKDSVVMLETLMGQRASRHIAYGEVITHSQIMRDKAVKYGETVKVISKGPSWQISVEAQARSSGEIGDSIKVYNPVTKKTMTGVLISRGVVEVIQQ